METDDVETIERSGAQRRFRIFAAQKGKDRLALAACMRSPRHKFTRRRTEALERARCWWCAAPTTI